MSPSGGACASPSSAFPCEVSGVGLDIPRWLIVVVLLLCVLGMLIWARGVQHHRGQYEGALGGTYVASQGFGG